MDVIKTAKISTKGQIVIPHKIRDVLGLEAEDEMVMTVRDEQIIMRKIHLGDIVKEAKRDYKRGKSLTHKDMETRYGV